MPLFVLSIKATPTSKPMKFYSHFLALSIAAIALIRCDSSKETPGSMSIAERRKFERSADEAIEKKIDDLLSQMTV